MILLENLFTPLQLRTLVSIVQVGDAAYWECVNSQNALFNHRYLDSEKNRIRTKFVQMQGELESHDPTFPFWFGERAFSYNQVIPELRTKNAIIHIARSASPDSLSYPSKYKIDLSYNNSEFQRQMILIPDSTPPYGDGPYYCILTFGGRGKTFAAIQLPEPGYNGIAGLIQLPLLALESNSEEAELVERKKAVLKEKVIKQIKEETVS